MSLTNLTENNGHFQILTILLNFVKQLKKPANSTENVFE